MLPRKKKANTAMNVIMVFGGIAIGLLVFGVTMVLYNVFLSQTRSMDIVWEGQTTYRNATNTTVALNKLQTNGNTLVDWAQLAILIGVFGALIAGMIFGGMYAYNKFK